MGEGWFDREVEAVGFGDPLGDGESQAVAVLPDAAVDAEEPLEDAAPGSGIIKIGIANGPTLWQDDSAMEKDFHVTG